MEFKIEGSDMKKKKVGRMGLNGHVYLPKDWIGKEIIVVLVDQ